MPICLGLKFRKWRKNMKIFILMTDNKFCSRLKRIKSKKTALNEDDSHTRSLPTIYVKKNAYADNEWPFINVEFFINDNFLLMDYFLEEK